MTSVLVLTGSTRDGFNAALARDVAEVLRARDVEVSFYEGLRDLPHYGEEFDDSGVDDHIDALRAAVAEADALLLVTPEYNGSPPSLLSNAVDIVSRPRGSASIAGKPVAVVGASPSPGGTARAREVLQRATQIAGASPLGDTVGVARAHERLDVNGYDCEVRAELNAIIDGLVDAVENRELAAAS